MINLLVETSIKPKTSSHLTVPLNLVLTKDYKDFVIGPDDLILITGASGFIGTRVVESLLERGFRNLRCFVRPSSPTKWLDALPSHTNGAQVDVFQGNLLSREDCLAATKDVAVVYHLAAG